jgi:solute:Na+ symporter, SSS family
VPLDANGTASAPLPQPVGEPIRIDDRSTQQVYQYPEGTRFRGEGSFRFDFLLYSLLGVDLTPRSNATLDTLDLPPKIVTPFLVMILVSFFTRPVRREALDRYYAKMKTMVDPDPEIDRRNLEVAYANPEALEHRKLFPGTSLEVQKPTRADVVGFVACFAVVGLIIVLAMLVARIGA